MAAGSLPQAALAGELDQARALMAQIQDLELRLTELRSKRDERLMSMWETTKRVRATIKGGDSR